MCQLPRKLRTTEMSQMLWYLGNAGRNLKTPLSSLETGGCEPNVLLSGRINIEDNAFRALLIAL